MDHIQWWLFQCLLPLAFFCNQKLILPLKFYNRIFVVVFFITIKIILSIDWKSLKSFDLTCFFLNGRVDFMLVYHSVAHFTVLWHISYSQRLCHRAWAWVKQINCFRYTRVGRCLEFTQLKPNRKFFLRKENSST